MATTAIQFEADIIAFADSIGADYGTTLKAATLDLFGNLILRTPVDEGGARGGWTVGVNEVGTAPPDREVKRGQGIPTEELAKLSAIDQDPFALITIINVKPYIVELENGSSTQAPAGIVALAIADSEADLRAALSV